MSTVSGWNDAALWLCPEWASKNKQILFNNREILRIKQNFQRYHDKTEHFRFQIYFLLNPPINWRFKYGITCAVWLNIYRQALTRAIPKTFTIATTILPPIQFLLWCCNFHSCRQPRPLFESRLKLLSHPLPTPVPFAPAVVLLTLVTRVP